MFGCSVLRWNTGTDVLDSFEDIEDVFLNRDCAGSLDAISSYKVNIDRPTTVTVSSGLTRQKHK